MNIKKFYISSIEIFFKTVDEKKVFLRIKQSLQKQYIKDNH